MTMTKRVALLEGRKPARVTIPPEVAHHLGVPDDVAQRIEAAIRAGTFPSSLSTDDLRAIDDTRTVTHG